MHNFAQHRDRKHMLSPTRRHYNGIPQKKAQSGQKASMRPENDTRARTSLVKLNKSLEADEQELKKLDQTPEKKGQRKLHQFGSFMRKADTSKESELAGIQVKSHKSRDLKTQQQRGTTKLKEQTRDTSFGPAMSPKEAEEVKKKKELVYKPTGVKIADGKWGPIHLVIWAG